MKAKMISTLVALTATLIFSGPSFAVQGQQGQQGTKGQQEMTQGKGEGLSVAPSTVREIQSQLHQQGFNPGKVDGAWGPHTSKALANYQRSKGLKPTGQINRNTLQTLGIKTAGQYGVAPQFGGQGQGQQQPQSHPNAQQDKQQHGGSQNMQ